MITKFEMTQFTKFDTLFQFFTCATKSKKKFIIFIRTEIIEYFTYSYKSTTKKEIIRFEF